MSNADAYRSYHGYVDQTFLQNAAALNQDLKRRSYALLHLHPGSHVLDAGCGPGTDTIDLAPLVGPQGRVVGLDHDPEVIDEANARAQAAGVQAWVEHRQGDATAMPFESAFFDACRSERLFLHVPNPVPAFAELTRVTKPGGRVVVMDLDGGSISIDSPEQAIERRIVQVWAEVAHNGYAGRQLYRLFKQHQLIEIAVEITPLVFTDLATARYVARWDAVEQKAIAAGVVTVGEVERYRASLEQLDAAGAHFSSGNIVMVSGRKP